MNKAQAKAEARKRARDDANIQMARSIVEGQWGPAPGRGLRKWATALLAKVPPPRAVLEHEEI